MPVGSGHRCCRTWNGLMLAAFFNIKAKLYQELMSNFMGKGDKETFAFGLLAQEIPFHLVRKSVGSIGIDV
jgi:alpha 1,2-mannosyltransferase